MNLHFYLSFRPTSASFYQQDLHISTLLPPCQTLLAYWLNLSALPPPVFPWMDGNYLQDLQMSPVKFTLF